MPATRLRPQWEGLHLFSVENESRLGPWGTQQSAPNPEGQLPTLCPPTAGAPEARDELGPRPDLCWPLSWTAATHREPRTGGGRGTAMQTHVQDARAVHKSTRASERNKHSGASAT